MVALQPARLALPRVVGHRGAAAHAPENTLCSLQEAAMQGARWVEFDAKLTHDRMPILMHDDTLARTAGLDVAVAELDHARIAELDVGRFKGPEFAGERVPTLAQALEACLRFGLRPNVEIKGCPGREVETAEVVLELAQRIWPADRPPPLVSSFSRASLAVAREHAASWPRGLCIDEPAPELAAWLDALACDSLHMDQRSLHGPVVAEMLRLRPVMAYTVNDPARALALWSAGVAGIFTDAPARLGQAADGFDRGLR